ncbi:MAG: DNA replication and repair protein RecF [Candidatus Berkelbacteria bacterium]|nr:MAG: DNA replication and repair protein RecF [Candidatus Berkelbacteria bacterium]QQG51721.1 MAG: DNA replication and repair protein RecF [Candidatus Berkelbacteria bacterium]
MTARRLTLEKFRNFEASSFELGAKTAVVGYNGSGKSNFIEALRLLSVGKSNKTSSLDEAICFDQPFFRLALERANDQTQTVDFFYGAQFAASAVKDRQLKVNNQPTSWAEFWGKFPSVLFVPDDLEIVIGAPQVRRRYLDGLLWQTDKEFRQNHLELSRVLRERSALLFLLKTNRAGREELSPWNDLLLDLGGKVRHHRKQYVEFLQARLTKDGPVFTDVDIELFYKENTSTPESVLKEELRLAQNLVGPHRDELEIHFGDRSARRYTSRGQARAIVVALKVAEAAFLAKRTGEKPLILLDDMFSELDAPTAEKLFNRFGDQYQIVATSIETNPLTKDWQQIVLK